MCIIKFALASIVGHPPTCDATPGNSVTCDGLGRPRASQYVEFENVKSDSSSIKTGVPQGSILGPHLIVIYVNNISRASKIFTAIIYADDTSLSRTLNTFRCNTNVNTNNELSKISEWLKVNKLSLNTKKTKMIFHMPQKQVTTPKLEIDGRSIEFVNSFNYLGITIDKHLSWQDHINSLANKISKYIGIINKPKTNMYRPKRCSLCTIILFLAV